MSYEIGDRILYPMHGAGTIEAIEEQQILGEKHAYYILRLPAGDMKVMLPIKKLKEIGVRDIITKAEGQKVLDAIGGEIVHDDTNWNKRYRDNMELLRSGDIYKVLDVVKSLMLRDKIKGLSTGERKMLSNSKQILISELVLSGTTNAEHVEKLLTVAIDEATAVKA